MNGQPWANDEFRLAFYSVGSQDSAKTLLRNWLKGKSPPDETRASMVERALFGNNPIFDGWRDDLEAARKRSANGQNRRTCVFPDAPLLVMPKASIPLPTTSFIGRSIDIEILAGVLSDHEGMSVVLVHGCPGIGKTELIKVVAYHSSVAQKFGAHRFYVLLENVSSVADMEREIAEAMGCGPDHPFTAIQQILKINQTLLVLDGLETLLETEREATEKKLAELATVATIVGSFRGFRQVRGLKASIEYALKPLSTDLAIELFAAVSGSWVLDDYRLDDVIESLDGMPLAIDLVARRAHNLSSLEPVTNELARIGSAFVRDPDVEENRHTSLAYSIELALDQLDAEKDNDPALLLFGLLGVLPAGLERTDIEGLIGMDAFSGTERLCRTGLAFEQNGRIKMLCPIREHARQNYRLIDYKNNWWANYFIEKLEFHNRMLERYPTDTMLYEYVFENYHNFDACCGKKLSDNDESDRVNLAINMMGQIRRLATELQKTGSLHDDFDINKYFPPRKIDHRSILRLKHDPMTARILRRRGIKLP